MPDGPQDPWRFGRRDFGVIAIAAAAAAVAGCESPSKNSHSPSSARPSASRPLDSSHTVAQDNYPKSAGFFLAQKNLPSADQFAHYDVVVIDNEWFGRVGPTFFDQLRDRNPGVRILAYVNLIDFPIGLGERNEWANRYALWQYQTPTESSFPNEWIATTAGGATLSQWPNTHMTNLTDAAPRIGGRTFAEYGAAWVIDHVWSAGVWDGIFLDVWGDRIWGANYDAWDYRRVGVNTPEDDIYGLDRPWERGINGSEILMRSRMPGAILVANGTRTMRDQHLNGRVWEDFLDVATEAGRGEDLATYLNECTDPAVRQPPYPMTINIRGAQQGSAQDYQRARYFLTATLLGNGYWAPTVNAQYAQMSYYDELDGGGLGRGYLGKPKVANPNMDRLNTPFADGLGVVGADVYRRDFDGGVVLHNASDSRQTVTFEKPLRHLTGTQDPDVNNGQVVASVDIGPRDGRILLRT